MWFTEFLRFLAVPVLVRRIGSHLQPPGNMNVSVSVGNRKNVSVSVGNRTFSDALKDETPINRALCNECVDRAGQYVDDWFFYSWKMAGATLVGRCSNKEPEENEGFKTSSLMDNLDDYCKNSDRLQLPSAQMIMGTQFSFSWSPSVNKCVDFLPECKKCAADDHLRTLPTFFWKVEGQGSDRLIQSQCGVKPPRGKGWERSPPPPRDEEHFKITQDWCKKTFKEDCGAPAWTGRGLSVGLKLFCVLVVVLAAAAGLYLARRRVPCEPLRFAAEPLR